MPPLWCCDAIFSSSRKVLEPRVVAEVVERIRRGSAAARRRADKCNDASVSSITPQDLLMGTCLRFDTHDRGTLEASALRKVNVLKLQTPT